MRGNFLEGEGGGGAILIRSVTDCGTTTFISTNNGAKLFKYRKRKISHLRNLGFLQES